MKTLAKYRRARQLFIETVGDKPIDEVVRRDVNAFLDVVSTREVGSSGKSEKRMISRETVNSYLIPIRSLLSLAISREWRDGPNPASDIKIEYWAVKVDVTYTPEKRRFSIAELTAIFQHPWFSGCEQSISTGCYRSGNILLDDMRYWAPVMALYTGARVAELGGLKVSDVALGRTPHITLKPNE